MIKINRYPYTDQKTNKLVQLDPIVMESVQLLSFEIVFKNKIIFAKIEKFPIPIVLFTGNDFDEVIKNLSIEVLQNKFNEKMGDNPEETLQKLFPRTLEADPDGPGSILSGMLSAIGITSTPNCSCKQRAIKMNEMGPDWCEQNLDEIMSWLAEEAKKRKLPFIDAVARLIVKRAISKSRRLLAKQHAVAQ